MFTAIHLKSGAMPDRSGLNLSLEPSITIFVGPNNSGKSLLLREIGQFCDHGSIGTYILDRFDCTVVDRETAQADFGRMSRVADPGELIQPQFVPAMLAGQRTQIAPNNYYLARLEPGKYPQLFSQYHLSPSTLSLDGSSRIQLLSPQQRGDLKYPATPLSRIFVDDVKRAKWRKIVHDAFTLYPGIDATSGSELSVRFGKTPPARERTLEQDIIDWMRSARSLDAVSDGVKAFSGILLQIYAGDPKVIIIDEPEAFLHPSLARTLGKELATAARTEQKFVFVSTHSADFLMGAVQSGAIVNIVRLTWDSDVATARLLPNSDLATLMNDPMLRSVGVLSGLFFQNVIVTEADADRAFYQEVNERLIASNDDRGIPHALFLNADNHQTIPAIVAPLRKLGIPAAGVTDLDVIKCGGAEWTRQLNTCGVPIAQHTAIHSLRVAILGALTSAAPIGTKKPDEYFKTAGGIDILQKAEKEAAGNFCDELDKYGLFLVRRGEVEAWLKHLGVPQKTNGWRGKIFSAMGSDPSSPTYVHPAAGDVWDFVGSIYGWLNDPDRRGIPD